MKRRKFLKLLGIRATMVVSAPVVIFNEGSSNNSYSRKNPTTKGGFLAKENMDRMFYSNPRRYKRIVIPR